MPHKTNNISLPSVYYTQELFSIPLQFQGYSSSLFNTKPELPSITNVIYNNPATIVYWNDNTKTVVKVQAGDTYNKEHGLVMCCVKKLFRNKGNYNDVLKNWRE